MTPVFAWSLLTKNSIATTTVKIKAHSSAEGESLFFKE